MKNEEETEIKKDISQKSPYPSPKKKYFKIGDWKKNRRCDKK